MIHYRNIQILPALAAAFLALAAATPEALAKSLHVSHLKCEGLETPTLVDTAQPRFSWRLESKERGVTQVAFQLRLVELSPKGEPTGQPVETARMVSEQSQWLVLPGFNARAGARYQWQVRVWDNQKGDSGWSKPATFETGLLGGDWRAEWLSDGRSVEKKAAPPARYFRKAFDLTNTPARARLYLSAMGVVEPSLNGQKVTEDLFLPGWPDYKRRSYYVAYDVTPLLQKGANAIGLVLGEDWYSSTLLGNHQYGPTPKVSGWIEITDADGKETIVSTDASWQWAEGPIRENGIYPGETYDARRADDNWCRAKSCAWKWQQVKVEAKPDTDMNARLSPPVQRIQEIKPLSRREVSPGVFIYDLGQNMVGWARLKVEAAAGSKIQMRFTEMLEADGSLHTKYLRSARATATYFTRSDGVETWEPCFSFFGFRCVELRPQIEAHLVRTIAAKNNHLATGFIGTPLLTPVLTKMGRPDLAYKVVLQETYPGWLFIVKNGATTIWERWDSWTPEKGFNKDGMNSFNRYAYGSVVEWFYDTIAGLKPDPAQPGWKHFEIAPTPGGGLTHSAASLENSYGVVSSKWRTTGDRFELPVTIPPSTTARVSLPATAVTNVTESGQPLAKLNTATDTRAAQGRVSFGLASGIYQFSMQP